MVLPHLIAFCADLCTEEHSDPSFSAPSIAGEVDGATACHRRPGRAKIFGDGMSYLTALLSNLVLEGKQKCGIILSVHWRGREKIPENRGRPGERGTRPWGRWTVCFRSGSATAGIPLPAAGAAGAGAGGGPRQAGVLLRSCAAGLDGPACGKLNPVFLDIEMEGPTAWIRPGALQGRQTRASSWYLSQGTVTMCFDGYEVGARIPASSPPGAEERGGVLTRADRPSAGEGEVFFCHSGIGVLPHRRGRFLASRSDQAGDLRHPPGVPIFFTGSWTRWLPSWGRGVRPHPPAVSGQAGAVDRVTRERGVGRGGRSCPSAAPASGRRCLP